MDPVPTSAVLLDSLGTLLRLEPPAPRLRGELQRMGLDVAPAVAEEAIAEEIAYYYEHHTEGRDASSLAELRNRCAAVVHERLELPELSLEAARSALLAALHFEPYPDVAPALRTLRARGLRLVVASNWDSSLHDVLGRAGLASLVDGVVTSAEVGARKPERALFDAALQAAGCPVSEAVHVGDSPENDVAGALRAGLRAVLLRRAGALSAGTELAAGVPVIASLAELPALV